MFEKVKEDAIDSEFRFRNPSIDQLRSNFGELVQSESVACEVIEELFIAVDIFPIQCFYKANIPKLLDLLRDKFPVFYKSYIAYTKYEFESVSKALLRAGQEPSETPLFTLGTVPYEELTKERGHFHFLLKKFKYPVRTCHPCSLLDPNSTCGLPRFQESDEALTQVSRFITGNENMVITYHQRFYDKHEPTIQAVLKRRLRTSFGGINESENQQNHSFGGIHENDNQRNSRKRTHYTPDDKLWSKNLILALQYKKDHEEVPKCIPRRLTVHLRHTPLNAKEKSDQYIIRWVMNQRRFVDDRGCKTMAQWRKDEFRTSGLYSPQRHYDSHENVDAKTRNTHRAKLERERYQRLDPELLEQKNRKRRERAASARAKKAIERNNEGNPIPTAVVQIAPT